MRPLSSEQIGYIYENYKNKTIKEIAEALDCSPSTVSNYRKRLGVSRSDIAKSYREYTDYIVANYYTKTGRDLAKEIGCSVSLISKIWRENGCIGKDCRNYYANFDFFAKIQSPNQAYLLGFIASDGCVYSRPGHQKLLSLSLQVIDQNFLSDIKTVLEAENPISISSGMATLAIVSDKMCNDLIKYGISERKTFQMNLHNTINHVPHSLHSHFLRGYFDGDGSITVRTVPSSGRVQFVLPYQNGLFLQEYLLAMGIKTTMKIDNRGSKPMCGLEATGSVSKYSLLNFLYLDSENFLSLQRKYKLSQELCSQIKNNITNRSENKVAVFKWEELLGTLKRQSAAEPNETSKSSLEGSTTNK